MPSFQGLLQRWGFVKLRRYGLELTPDGRILSTRPAVLDDGTGTPIVGWRDGDVAIWKFSSWKADPPEAPPVASRVAMPQPAAPAVPRAEPAAALAVPAPAAKLAITKPSPPGPEPSRPSAAVMPLAVAGDAPVDEDDWEWTIALARARVAVDEAESARPPEPPIRSFRAVPEPRPTPPPIAARDSASSAEWPTTELIGAIDYDDDSRFPTRPAIAVPRPAPVAVAIPRTTPANPTGNTPPSTVIPVPALPSMATMLNGARSRMEPVVRSAQVPSSSAAAAARFAKGTGPVDPPAETRPAALIVEDTIPNLSVGDRTRPGVAMPRTPRTLHAGETGRSSVGDRTKPGIALPAVARAVELPSIKRRMSPR